MRQERRGLREQLKQKLGDSDAVDRIAPSLDQPYMFGGAKDEFDDDPNTTNLYLSNLPMSVSLIFLLFSIFRTSNNFDLL